MSKTRGETMSEKLQCAKCTKTVCNSKYFDQGAAYCPTQTRVENWRHYASKQQPR